MTAQIKTEAKATVNKAFVEKWGQPLIDAGYGVAPNVIIQRHKQLGLDATELTLYFLIASFWWKASERPFPSMLELGKAMGMHVRNIQRRLQKMEAVGFIRIYKRKSRHGGNKSNEYDLTPLIKAATKLALEESARKKKASLDKLGRKPLPGGKPPLKVVKG